MCPLHMNLSPDYYSCLALCSFLPPSIVPRATAQLYLVLPEAVSAAKPCFLRDPAMMVSPGLLPPTDAATLYFLGRVRLLRVEPTLTTERDFRRKCRAFSLPFHLPPPLPVVPTGSDQLVSITDPSMVGHMLGSAGR
jgi:hypothetical protein